MPHRPRSALLCTLGLTLVLGGCGDGGDDDAPDDDGPSVTVEDVRGDGAADTLRTERPAATDDGDDATAARTRTLYAVQVGAFTREGNAATLRERLEEESLPVWTSSAEIDGRTYRRVRVGASESVEEARRLARELSETVEPAPAPWVAPVTPDEELPPEVVDRTGEATDGG